MDQITIRAMEPEDIPALTALMNQPRAVWGTLQVPFVSVAERRRRAETHGAGLRLVAEIGGRVVGNLGLQRYADRRAHVGAIGMAVHDEFAGRGCGRALLAAALDQADKWLNLRRIELSVWTDNAPAIALYERFGFAREGLARAYAWRDGAYADALMMARLRIGTDE